jgi:esterase
MRVTEMTKEQQGTVALMQGVRVFPSFDAILEITTAAAPHRDRKSLRRGVFHNTKQLDNGTWTWRWDPIREFPDFDGLWDDVAGLSVPVRLIRGGTSGFVTDEDADELARRAQQFRGLQVVQNSGHSVQSDQPLVLTEILRGVLDGG